MALSYNRLWKMLIDKKMTKTQLRFQAEMSQATLAKLGRDETVSMDVMIRICNVFKCEMSDVMEVNTNDNN